MKAAAALPNFTKYASRPIVIPVYFLVNIADVVVVLLFCATSIFQTVTLTLRFDDDEAVSPA